ncbi:MAG: toprim domain-containing protein, partial [Trebonia sp.]
MSTPQPAGPGPDRDAEPRQRLPELRARLRREAGALRTPGDWAACLRLAALMPGEDFANILLISAQRPGAVTARGYSEWAAAGRQVRHGEKGLETFRIPSRPAPRRPQDPGPAGDEPPPTWRDASQAAYVWDVSQTTGRTATVPAGLPPPGPAPAGLWDALCHLARREGFTVEREYGAPADGTTFWAARRIRLLPGLTTEQAVWALAHQLGHIQLHDTPGGHPPGVTTTGCTGLRKAEADAVAYLTCARHGVTPAGELAYPASWAGTDPRAQPAEAILAAGQRIATAAAHVTRQTDRALHGDDPAPATAIARHAPPVIRHATAQPATAVPPDTAAARPAETGPPAEPAATKTTRRILQRAQDFYSEQLAGSWAPAYLETRGISVAVAAEWHIGHAPAGWTELIDHLRRLPHGDGDNKETEAAGTGRPPRTGYSDEEIEAAGLAKRSSRGTLIDVFRDRVVLPVHDERGDVAGFIGRVHPDRESTDVPRYLNSPESANFKKGSLLFGLHQGRAALARGAVPVLVEGPFDAIAVSRADPGRHVGLAPCGTALTSRQTELVSQTANLPRTGILACFDADTAGRKATARAYGILRPHTPKLQAARLSAKDPATIFEQDGPQALRTILREDREPLSAVLIDARIAEWDRYLDHVEGRYRAMHSTASLVAGLLPEQAAAQVRRITAGRKLVTVDDMARPVDNPELPLIAQVLPADTAYQVTRAAVTLGFDVTEVLAAVTNAVTDGARPPKGHALRRDDRERTRPAPAPE